MTTDIASVCPLCTCTLIFDSRSPTCERWICSCGYFVMRALDLRVVPPIPGIEQRCARCGVQIDDLAAHQERCFVVGDWVRWEHSLRSANWVEGEVTRLAGHISISIAREGPGRTNYGGVQEFGIDRNVDVRRIPRPGQEVAACQHPLPWKTDGSGWVCQRCDARGLVKPDETLSKAEIDAKRTEPTFETHGWRRIPPAPTLYDGRTATWCLEMFTAMQREERDPDDSWGCARIVLTESQRNIARFMWSASLAAKVAASLERSRRQVVLEQDAEDFEW